MKTILERQPENDRLADRLAEQGVQFAFASFVDVTGRVKSKCVPVAHLADLLAGHERYTPRGLGDLGQMTPDEDECVAVPDPDTLLRPALGPAVRPHDRRPVLRRPGAVRPVHPLHPEEPDRAGSPAGLRTGARGRDRAVCRGSTRPAASGYLEPAQPVRAAQAHPRLRRGGHARPDAVPGADGGRHERDRLRRLQLRPRRRRRAGRVRLRPRPRPGDGGPAGPVPPDGQADRQAERAAGHLHAQAVHRGVGLGGPLQYEPGRCRQRRQRLS